MVGRTRADHMENFPAKMTAEQGVTESYPGATKHSVKVWDANHRPVLGS